MLLLAALLAISTPTDRSYVLAETGRPIDVTAECARMFFDKGGSSVIEPADYGQKVVYRYGNLGGTVKDPTMILEIHEGDKRGLLLYGFGGFKGATKNMWKQMSKKCFPELLDAPLVKPE